MNQFLVRSFLGGLLLGLVPVIFGHHWIGLDLFRMDLGSLCEWRNLVLAGKGLLVSHHIAGGVPFLADPLQSGFYPLRWIALWLPSLLATDMHVALHLGVAALGAAILFRTYGFNPRWIPFLAFAYCLSGTVLDCARHSPYLVGAAWLPVAWGSARLCLRRPSLRWPRLLLSLALGFQLLGGDAVAWTWSFIAVLVEIISSLLASRRDREARLLLAGRTLLLALAGSGLGTLVWIPAWRELHWSYRAGKVDLSLALYWAWNFKHWPALFLPGVFKSGNLLGGSLWTLISANTDEGPVWNNSAHLGVIVLLGLTGAAIQALRNTQWKRARIYLVPLLLGTFALLFSLGESWVLTPWIFKTFPALTNLRYPAKAWVMINPAATLIASLSWREMLRLRRGLGTWLARLGLVAWAGTALYIFSIRNTVLYNLTRKLAAMSFYLLTPDAPQLSEVLLKAMIPGGIALITLVLTFQRKLRWVGICAAITLEIGLSSFLNSELSPNLKSSPFFPSVLRQEEGEPEATYCRTDRTDNLGLARKEVKDREDLWTLMVYQRLVSVTQVNACDHVRSGHNYSVLEEAPRRKMSQYMDNFHSSAAAMGCTHKLTMFSTTEKRENFPEAGEMLPVPALEDLPVQGGMQLKLFKLKNALPEFYSVQHPFLAKGMKEGIQYLKPYRPAEEVLSVLLAADPEIEKVPGLEKIQNVPVEGKWESGSVAEIQILKPEARPGIVGIRIPFSEGWRATQGGKPLIRVRPADNLLAAYVPDLSKGPVRFEYSLPDGNWAVLLSTLSLVAILTLCFYESRKKRLKL